MNIFININLCESASICINSDNTRSPKLRRTQITTIRTYDRRQITKYICATYGVAKRA